MAYDMHWHDLTRNTSKKQISVWEWISKSNDLHSYPYNSTNSCLVISQIATHVHHHGAPVPRAFPLRCRAAPEQRATARSRCEFRDLPWQLEGHGMGPPGAWPPWEWTSSSSQWEWTSTKLWLGQGVHNRRGVCLLNWWDMLSFSAQVVLHLVGCNQVGRGFPPSPSVAPRGQKQLYNLTAAVFPVGIRNDPTRVTPSCKESGKYWKINPWTW